MKQLLNVFLFGFMLMGLLACEKDDDKAMFVVEGERTFSVTKEGDLLSVILRTTQDYRVTPEGDWCTILAKQSIGFKIQVNENVTIKERENKITIETNDFESVVLTIKQEAGELFFRMDESEKRRMFEQAGGMQTVVLTTNLDEYEVISPESWCVVTAPTKEGFTLNVEENDDIRRQANLVIRAQGMEDINVLVIQNGAPFLKNPYFLDGNFDPWVIERSASNAFVVGTWIPGSITDPEKSRFRAVKIDAGGACDGSIFQTVTGIPDGIYTLTFIAQAGGSSTDGSYLNLVIKDSNDIQISSENIHAEARGGWRTITRELNITGGKVTIGLSARRGSSSGIWFHALGFVLE